MGILRRLDQAADRRIARAVNEEPTALARDVARTVLAAVSVAGLIAVTAVIVSVLLVTTLVQQGVITR